ncbi:MAG TPA: dihydroorotate dehydrogenase-like protein [Chromatiales bacterium]|nr:dihydroorotate dehydrogenase-like protein [Thiotrichales bacterium]HIP68423.1 dihydroorotate dehydrogenase-like protein [Chromatiales bacterium]
MTLKTNYLGLELKNPLVPSASPLSRDLDMAKRLEDAGASALVMYSLFEEEITREEEELEKLWECQDIGHCEADDYLPVHYDYRTQREEYLEQLAALKESLEIPVIASLNGITASGWTEHAKELQDAGADALELNIYYVAADMNQTSQEVEDRYIKILKAIKAEIYLPITVKLSYQFSSPAYLIKQLEHAGADGVVLFNRFFHPDIDINRQEVTTTLMLSNPYEALMRLHWIGLLYNRVHLSMAATGGIHSANEVIKLLLAGADVTHLCTTLLENGPGIIKEILRDIKTWMEEYEYESIEQLKGSVSQMNVTDPAAYERANYMEILKKKEYSPGSLSEK